MSLPPLILAGSAFGPISTKSLYMTSKRCTPKPSATNFSSCALACTNTTSASPRRPVSSACPVPCATTFTSMPVLALNSGRMWPNRPESCVDVVEATTIDLSCATASDGASASDAAASNEMLRAACSVSLSYKTRSPAMNRRAASLAGWVKKAAAGACSATRPLTRSTTSPARRRAWPRSCVAKTIFTPDAAMRAIRSSTILVCAGSRLAVASSSRSSCGRRASARAMARRCCSPPDSLRAGRSASAARPT